MRLIRRRGDERAAAERVGLVEAQLLIVVVTVVLQLWLLTVALEQFLAGDAGATWSLAAFSALGFLIALLVLVAHRER
jgi:cytochrome bd-type quinol oxidase subunit 2